MSIPVPVLEDNDPVGSWEVWVYPAGVSGPAVNATFVRGAPTMIGSMETEDPFGPSTAELKFPSVSMLDRVGTGDLWWLRPWADVDICFMPPDSDIPLYRWEGYMMPFAWTATETGSELTVTCVGAMLQMDNYLAKPEYVYQPLPYELAIARQFDGHPDSRLAPLTVEWPEWWSTVYRSADYAGKGLYLVPDGVVDGDLWSGLVTRSTGSFDPSLTGYIQSLLSSMYSEYGQFTLDLDEGRRPVLRHRTRVTRATATTLVVDILQPGVKVEPAQDFSQTLNVVYGQGKGLNGATFSGMRSSADGTRQFYEPLAYRNQVHPLDHNPWFDPAVMRKEVNLSFVDGLSEAEARVVARKHLQRFSDPGTTATIELMSDPKQDGVLFPRQLIRAGMGIQVTGLFGEADGALFHIVKATVTPESTKLTVDTKYRDLLTVMEVRARTRDALAPIRLMTVGAYKPNIPDMLFPWSYADGSGYLPKASVDLFDDLPEGVSGDFPWEDLTRRRPPADPRWSECYVRIGPASSNADDNWAQRPGTASQPAFPIRMSQAGEARLIQVAAFDESGNRMNVPFHVSLYRTNSVSATAMPMLGLDDEAEHPPYLSGQHYPFFRRAWEQIDENGVALNPETGRAVTTAQLIVGFGNYFEKAGYWPSSSAQTGAVPTGLLSDESGFSWDLTDAVYGVDPQRSAEENLKDPNRADIWAMIYCDAQAERPVYFLGRIWRKEPGTA